MAYLMFTEVNKINCATSLYARLISTYSECKYALGMNASMDEFHLPKKNKCHTVKLGYNDHGYNEFIAITYRKCSHFRPQVITLLHKYSRL
jgi:hypothetical protein